MDNFQLLINSVKTCQQCGLCKTRTNAVPGEGKITNAPILFIGEAPGADEDKSGRPFVGRAGQLLTDIIEKGLGVKRSEVYITNVVKCRPSNNRVPLPGELANCYGFWRKEIDFIKPCVIITLGKTAFFTMANIPLTEKLGPFRLQQHNYMGIPVVPTWHPSYLLRNPAAKRDTWEDIKFVKRVLNEI